MIFILTQLEFFASKSLIFKGDIAIWNIEEILIEKISHGEIKNSEGFTIHNNIFKYLFYIKTLF